MKLRVLITDDSKTVRKIMRLQLEEMGHEVVAEASNGHDAMELYFKYTPDLITMDIQMPDMNGLEASAKIRKVDKNVKIIMVTAHGQKDLVMSCLKNGIKYYMLKPITSDKLKEVFEKIYG
ncbi:response regulator [Sulfurimonas sp.]|nr:response regulator [Sulfurimonas sp.]